MTDKEAERLLEECAARLGEHFDAVEIMVTFPTEGGGTTCVKRGSGNWYARQGMAHEFINSDIAQDAAQQIAARINPPDETDDWKEPA